MKRTLIIIICILGIYSLVACNRSKETEKYIDNIISPTEVMNHNTATTEAPNSTTTTSDEQIYSTESEGDSIVINDNFSDTQTQIKIIVDNIDLWTDSMDYANERYHYAITDLDNNKRLEIIASNIGGTGFYTYSSFYEIDESFKGLTRCETNFTEGDSQADIAVDSVPAYYDPKTKIIYYIFDDLTKNGAAEYYENKRALYLDSGQIKETPLAYKSTIYIDSSANITYEDVERREINENDYSTIADKVFADLEKKNVSFGWCGFSNPDDLKDMSTEDILLMLIKSYEEFVID